MACACLATSAASQPIDLQPAQHGEFETYVLAISWQPAFCQMQYAEMPRNADRGLPAECNPQAFRIDKRDHLTLHGLWPSLPKTLEPAIPETDKPKAWETQGCSVLSKDQPAKAEKKCETPDFALSPPLLTRLAQDMPGVASCLHRYEYAKHGACFAFPPEAYFQAMSSLLAQFRASKAGAYLADRYGETASLSGFQDAAIESFGPTATNGIKLECGQRDGRHVLSEIRISIRRTGLAKGLTSPADLTPAKTTRECPAIFHVDPRGVH